MYMGTRGVEEDACVCEAKIDLVGLRNTSTPDLGIIPEFSSFDMTKIEFAF